ncbi:MAG: FecR domain-containing protein [Lentisphaerales bacterium]|nr:FecR domain-containing protein [Lentisphaerales bacterium]
MRQSELFDAYLSGELTKDLQIELSDILKSEEGSKAFVEYIAESYALCEFLKNKDEAILAEAGVSPAKTNWPIRLVALAACLIFAFVILQSRVENETSVSVVKHEKLEAQHEDKKVTLKDGSQVTIAKSSSLTVIDSDHLELATGVFHFKVKERSGKKPLRINMTNGFLEILGTEFSVQDEPQVSLVSVKEGRVRVSNGFKEVILTDGEEIQVTSKSLAIPESSDLELHINGSLTANGNLKDLSPYNRVGDIKEGIVIEQDSIGEYLKFQNTDHAWVNDIDLQSSFSLAVWVRIKQVQNSYDTILSKGDSSWRLSLRAKSTQIHFALSGMEPEYLNSQKALEMGVWYHVTAVYDEDSMQIYINGELDSKTQVTGTLLQNMFPVELGGNSEVHFRNLQGDLDECRIYSKALRGSEIKRLYLSGR